LLGFRRWELHCTVFRMFVLGAAEVNSIVRFAMLTLRSDCFNTMSTAILVVRSGRLPYHFKQFG